MHFNQSAYRRTQEPPHLSIGYIVVGLLYIYFAAFQHIYIFRANPVVTPWLIATSLLTAIHLAFMAKLWKTKSNRDQSIAFLLYVAQVALSGLYCIKPWTMEIVFAYVVTALIFVWLMKIHNKRKFYAEIQHREMALAQASADNYAAQNAIHFEAVKSDRTFADIHGMAEVKERIKKAAHEIVRPYQDSAKTKKPNTNPVSKPRNGMLLFGAPGNGKTVFGEALAGELDLPMVYVTFGDVASKWVNETTERVVKVFRDAEAQAPCILYLDEVDSLISKRDGGGSTEETGRTANTILTELVSIRGKGVIVMAATNFFDRLDQAAIREGRFDYKIEVTPPDLEARIGLLTDTIQNHVPTAAFDLDMVKRAAARWEGYSVKRILSIGEELGEMTQDAPPKWIDLADVMAALRRLQGRKGRVSPDTKSLAEMILPEDLREQLQTIALRMKDIERVEKLGGKVPSGILFFGEPGTGKTEAARAIGKETDWAFLNTTGNDLIMDPSKMDKLIAEAADIRPCIVFIDEADDILADRRGSNVTSVTNKLLAAMDGAQGKVKDVVYIAATNHPDHIDPAALRRFSEKLYFPMPDEKGLAQFAASWVAKSPATFAESLTPAGIAELLGDDMSIANAAAILQEAVNCMIGRSLGEDHPVVEVSDLQKARKNIMAQV
jgi:transitional endoplasmic reticulum ATPase